MRLRRFLILFGVAAAAAAGYYFSMRESVSQSIAGFGQGFGQLLSLFGGESPRTVSPSLSLPPSHDSSSLAVLCGFAAFFALWAALHQLAAWYDERA